MRWKLRAHVGTGNAPRSTAAVGMALLAGAAAGCCRSTPSGPTTVSIAGDAIVVEVDDRFLSVAVDSAQLVGGEFWDPSGDPDAPTTLRVAPYDFDRPALRRLASELAPAYLRLGGTDADRILYDLSDAPVSSPPQGYRWVLGRRSWDAANRFATDLGFRILFTLNAGPGPRDADGRWLPDNARQLVADAAARGCPVDVWELGNEINGYPLLLGLNLSATQYAQDLAAARKLIAESHPGARLAAPAVAFWPSLGELRPVLNDILAAGGASIDVVTWHFYPQQSRRCPIAVQPAGPEVLLDPRRLDEAATWAAFVEDRRDAHAPGTPVWLGETGNAQCGGEPGVSDAFAGSLWWVDQLGLVARRGQPVMVRQTLSGSNYGLLDDATLRPNPDYWASWLWRRLVGTRVLDARRVAGSTRVRAYAHCAATSAPGRQSGAVTGVLVNLDPTASVTVALRGLDASPADVYAVTADALTAREVRLNGSALAAAEDGTVPAPAPRRIDPTCTGVVTVELAPASYAFVVVPQAGARACP